MLVFTWVQTSTIGTGFNYESTLATQHVLMTTFILIMTDVAEQEKRFLKESQIYSYKPLIHKLWARYCVTLILNTSANLDYASIHHVCDRYVILTIDVSFSQSVNFCPSSLVCFAPNSWIEFNECIYLNLPPRVWYDTRSVFKRITAGFPSRRLAAFSRAEELCLSIYPWLGESGKKGLFNTILRSICMQWN